MITDRLALIYETWLTYKTAGKGNAIERTGKRLDLPETLVRRIVHTISRYIARQVLHKAKANNYYRRVK